MIRRKLLAGWIASAVLLLVVTGLVFGVMLRSTQRDYIRSDLAKSFAQISQRLDERRAQVHRAAVLLAERPEVIAGLHLIDSYEDPKAYEPLVFDPEKRRLAALARDEARSVGVDAVGLFDRHGGMAAVYTSGRASGFPPGAGYSTWTDGKRRTLPLSEADSLTHRTGLERLAPSRPPLEPRDRLLTVNDRFALLTEAPVPSGMATPDGNSIGMVMAGNVYGLDDIADIVARSSLRAAFVAHGTPVPAAFVGVDLERSVIGLAQAPENLILQERGGWLTAVVALPLEGDGRVFIILSVEPPNLGAVLSTYGEASLLALLPMVLFFIPAGAYALQRWVIGPLEVLAGAAEAVRRGNAAEVRLAERDDELGSVARTFNGMVRDLVTREHDLMESRRSYQELYDYAPAAYATVRADDGAFLRFNRAFVALLEYTADELPAIHALDVYMPDGAGGVAEARAAFTRFRNGEAVRDQELRMRRKSGAGLWVSLTLEPVRDAEGRVVEGRLIVIDIDARKQAEEALRQSVDALTQANVELTQFATVAAHDLREPVRQLVSYTQFLERDLAASLTDDQKEHMGYIVDGARRMYDLVGALLDYAGAGQGTGRRNGVDVGRVLSVILETLQLSIKAVGAEVVVGPMPTVMGDEVQLVQVFQNLITNALKFQAPDNTPRVRVRAEQNGPNWVFHITDNGIGFDASQTERVFGMFERLHPEQNYVGTGIGLPICRKIIEANGGRIWATSSEGEGSTFSFLWPGNCFADFPVRTPAEA
ncbi:MAG: ATP-binding protein [Rhodospirillaceae bacterium]